jgi:hypothetical protein
VEIIRIAKKIGTIEPSDTNEGLRSAHGAVHCTITDSVFWRE